MKKLILFFLSIIFLLALFLPACKTDPLIVEVPGEITDTNSLAIISLIETDLCNGDIISFQRQVLPILVAGCAYEGCHSTSSHEEGVILDNYNKIKKEVTPGDPNDSELYESITENPNDDDFMPPKPVDPLTDEQINIIKVWIEQGAKETDCNIYCNSDEASFAQNVFPIIQNNCYGCHQAQNAQGSINLEDYEHIRTFASNGLLLGSIKHTLGYEFMPSANYKLTDCQIATIQNWIAQGYSNN